MRTLNNIPDASTGSFYNPCSGALSIVMPQEAINQIMNPSFELYNDVYGIPFANWQITHRFSGSNTTITDISGYIVSGENVWSGANSVYTGNFPNYDFITLRYNNLSIQSGSYYAWSFYIFGAQGSHGREYTANIAASGTTIAFKRFNIIEGQWQRIEVVGRSTITSTVATVAISKQPIGSDYAGSDVYIDACQFEKITVDDADIGMPAFGIGATTYFDGDTNGFIDDATGIFEFAWQGQPHRSMSTRSGMTAAGGKIYNLQDEFGLEIIGIAEAGINQPQVQTLTFNSQDGGSLQDIINPVRTITLIGQIHGLDKIDLSRKIQRLTALLSRDLVPYRQDRKFLFQHLDGRDPVGVPLSFSGSFAGGLNVMVTDTLSVNVDISILMHDPYFYGHDEAVKLELPQFVYNRIYKISQFGTDSATTIMQEIADGLNGSVNTIAQAPDGRLWIGGSFTATLSGTSLPYICIYNPATNAFSPVPGGTLNGAVNTIKFAPNGVAWIGGSFTGTMGNYFTGHNGLAYVNVGNFNNIVFDMAIVSFGNEYNLYVVGQFTTAPSGTALRIAKYASNSGLWSAFSTDNGFNNIVYSIVYNPRIDVLYVGGSFIRTNASTVLCTRVAQIGQSSGITSTVGTGIPDGLVTKLYVDDDGTLVIGGAFGTTFINLAYFSNGVIRQWPANYQTAAATFPPLNSIFKYKDGIFAGFGRSILNTSVIATPPFKTDLPSLGYWNGTALSGSAWIPIANGSYFRYCGFVLPNGDLYVGTIDNDSDYSAVITHGRNTSTVQSYPTIRMQNVSTQNQVNAILNVRDDKIMMFNDRMDYDGSSVIDRDFVFGDIITIKPKYSTVRSLQSGNLIRVVNVAGAFSDFVLRPGNVDLSLLINSYTGDTTYNIEVYWPQTFQTLFDGVYKS